MRGLKKNRFLIILFFFVFYSNVLSAYILAIIGPSGVGKSTIANYLINKYPFIHLSVSSTTREIRKNEIPGVDYNYFSQEQFKKLIQENAFFEWTFANGNYYGSLRDQIQNDLKNNFWVIKIVNAQGVEALKKTFGEEVKVIYVTLTHPEELEKRLIKRGTETLEQIQKRLKNNISEVQAINYYDYSIVNDDLDLCFSQFDKLIEKLQKPN
jgi:guanylate kinase